MKGSRPAEELPPFEPSLVGALWRYRLLALCIILGLVGAAAVFSLSRPDLYKATATILVEPPQQERLLDQGVQLNQQRYVADQTVFIQSRKVAERAAEIAQSLPGGAGLTVGDIYGGLDVAFNEEVNSRLRISMVADDPEAAAAGANAVVQGYKDVRTGEAKARAEVTLAELDNQIKAIDGERDSLRRQLAGASSAVPTSTNDAPLAEQAALIERRSELLARRDRIATDTIQGSAGIVFSEPAIMGVRVSSHLLRNVVLAGLFGLLLSSFLAYFLLLHRRRFAERHDPEEILGAPLLSDVPDFAVEGITSALPLSTDSASAAAEAFRFVASSMTVQRNGTGPLSIVVTSALLGEGKSTVAANTAMALAEAGARVLLVDADPTTQALTTRLLGRRHDGPGLVDLIAGRARLDEAVRKVKVGGGVELRLLPAGSRPAPAKDFFADETTAEFFQRAKVDVDFLIIDGLPILQVAYATSLVNHADQALVVVPHNGEVGDQENLVARLGLIGKPVMGYVYNRAPLRPELKSYYAQSTEAVGASVGRPTQPAGNVGSAGPLTPEPEPVAEVTATPEPEPVAEVTATPEPEPVAEVTATPEGSAVAGMLPPTLVNENVVPNPRSEGPAHRIKTTKDGIDEGVATKLRRAARTIFPPPDETS